MKDILVKVGSKVSLLCQEDVVIFEVKKLDFYLSQVHMIISKNDNQEVQPTVMLINFDKLIKTWPKENQEKVLGAISEFGLADVLIFNMDELQKCIMLEN